MDVPEISVRDAQRLLDSPTPPRLIDVREPDEWDLCRIAGAELVPLSAWPALLAEKLPDPHAPLLLYCHHGGRSGRATEFLLRNGFTNVTNVSGGIDAWAVEIDSAVARY